nr:hypothetical protein BdHM001_35750 [Bdellovibrio sp. HM001]
MVHRYMAKINPQIAKIIKKPEAALLKFATKHQKAAAAAGVLSILYMVLIPLTTKVRFDRTRMTMRSGLIFRPIESIDMVKIEDHQVGSNIFANLLGYCSIKIFAPRDVTNKQLKIRGIPVRIALELDAFVAAQSQNSMVEHLKSRESQGRSYPGHLRNGGEEWTREQSS